HVLTQTDWYQRAEQLQEEGGQFMFDFDGDEIFHVDLNRTETVWRLREFGEFSSFEAQGALQNMAVMRQNLDIMIKRSNRSQAAFAPPEVSVFPKNQAELEKPNVLTCFADKFWPPVISISWRKNGQEVTDGVLQTVYYPRGDNTFRVFSYLLLVPARGDIYDCQVEHWALPGAVRKNWEPTLPVAASETAETLLCALGLAVGIVGIVGGTVLIIRAMRMGSARNRRDPL
ncbi:DRA protein, partial [Rhinopomastus cyanomelas]|nr:DRA protein [Rhinopomastus cyanomelas]